jgi:gliding motility-associated-like protein
LNNRYKILFILFFSLLFQDNLFTQIPISGVINKYTKVVSISSLKDTVLVTDASLFSDGDTVLIMQMRGAEGKSYTYFNEELFGRVDFGSVEKAGKYEILILKKVIIAENKIVLRNPLDKLYDTSKKVQLIRVPSYTSANVVSELTCDPWDGDKGGVLVFMVADTLSLNSNINIIGKGFRGALPALSNGDCTSSDSVTYRQFYFNEAFDGAGRKGEGIADDYVGYEKGLGRWSNGGGGGNGRFTGGGGGSNAGRGGLGGNEDTTACITPKYIGEIIYSDPPVVEPIDTVAWVGIGGRGGQELTSPMLFTDSTIFLGGGGGSGTYTNDLTASAGGNGGGIAIVLSNYVKPNGFGIITDGQSVTDPATASGGGGGGGGVIVIDIESVESDLVLSVKGGNGGNTQGVYASGQGGGGGGGIILNGLPVPDPKFKTQTNAGKAGYVSDKPGSITYGATDGSSGAIRNNYSVPLTGFLFNSILENQRICIGDVPKNIHGSTPKGGDGTFVFEWQKKTNYTSWSKIIDSTRRDFQPPALYDTTYYRRIVSSAGVIDTSLAIGIYIHKKIQGNQIWGVDTICIENPADTLFGTTVTIGGDGSGIYSYIWQSSFDQSSWSGFTAVSDTVCWGGIITDTTYYRRKVSSGACFSYSDTIEIVGLPKITNNTLPDNQEICYAQIPNPVIGQDPDNGLGIGSYSYFWEKSEDSVSWELIADSIRKDFFPSNLIETVYYRRGVVSGDCMDYSQPHKVNVLPNISSNTIINSDPISTCYEIPSELIVGSDPTGGDNVYRYQWQISNDNSNWENITENATSKDYQPLPQTEKKYYRRIVSSGISDCCINIGNSVSVEILPLPVGQLTDFDTTICSLQPIDLDFEITSGSGTYTLYYSDGFTSFQKATSQTNTVLIVTPESLVTSKQFTYSIDSIKDSEGCLATTKDGEVTALVYGWPVSDPGLNDEICDTTYILNAIPSLGKGLWSQVDGPGAIVFDDDTLYNSPMHIDVSGTYSIKWREINWQCADSTMINVLLYRAASVNAGADTILHYETDHDLVGQVFNSDTIKQNEIVFSWDKLSGPGDIIENGTNATLSGLGGFYKEKVVITFSIDKPGCPILPDTIILTLKDLLLPTGFSPNGDGVNDVFVISGGQNSITNELIIYNKWGTEVYRMPNYGKGEYWDGKNMKGNILPEDTYFYIFNYTDYENKTHSEKGFVILKGQGND